MTRVRGAWPFRLSLNDKKQHIDTMKITVNDKEMELAGSTVSDLVRQLGVPSNGVAVAVGMDIVPREEWESRALTEGCKVMIIRAASGG